MPPTDLSEMKVTAYQSMLWVAVDKWFNRIASLLVFAILGRLLAPTDLGLAALAATFVILFSLIGNQGFSSAIVQRADLSREHIQAAFVITMATSVGLYAVIAVAADPISAALHTPKLANVLRISALTLPIDALSAVPSSLLERDFRFKLLAQRHLTANAIGGGVAVAVAFTGGGVWSVVAQTVATSTLSTIILFAVTDWRPAWHFQVAAARELRSIGLGVFGIQLFGYLNSQSDKLLIGVFLDPAAVGYYYIGSRIISILIDIQTSVIQSVSLTTFSKYQRDKDALRRIFYKFASMSAAVSIFSFAALAALAPIAIPLVFGDKWDRSVLITQILCLLGALNSILVFDRTALIGVGRPRLALGITAVQSCVGVAAILCSVWWGPVGVAIAVTVRQYLVWPFRIGSLTRALSIQIRPYLAGWFGPAAAGLISAVAMWVLVELLPSVHTTFPRLSVCVLVGAVGFVIYVVFGRLLFRRSMRDIGAMLPSRLKWFRHSLGALDG